MIGDGDGTEWGRTLPYGREAYHPPWGPVQYGPARKVFRFVSPPRRPWLCRNGFHRWGPNARWSGSTRGLVRWERHCARRRCGALLAFSAEPFLWGPVDRWRYRRRT